MIKDWNIKDLKCECKVITKEDWHPTDDGHLTLTVLQAQHFDLIRICIWGGDDFGMEKDYTTSEITFDEAKNEADVIPEPVTVKWLLENGFVYA